MTGRAATDTPKVEEVKGGASGGGAADSPNDPDRLVMALFRLDRISWRLLIDPRAGEATLTLVKEAIATAQEQPGHNGRGCFVCSALFSPDRVPIGALLTEPASGKDGGVVAPIGSCCWPNDGNWTPGILAAIHRTFGIDPAAMRPVHAEGTA